MRKSEQMDKLEWVFQPWTFDCIEGYKASLEVSLQRVCLLAFWIWLFGSILGLEGQGCWVSKLVLWECFQI